MFPPSQSFFFMSNLCLYQIFIHSMFPTCPWKDDVHEFVKKKCPLLCKNIILWHSHTFKMMLLPRCLVTHNFLLSMTELMKENEWSLYEWTFIWKRRVVEFPLETNQSNVPNCPTCTILCYINIYIMQKRMCSILHGNSGKLKSVILCRGG